MKVAIVGSGFGQYGLLPAFRSMKGCTVVAFCGPKRPQLTQYFKKIGFTNLYADWRLMLKKEKLDAIAIAVPPRVQYQIAKAAIKQGLHVFAEKPLALTEAQAKELLTLAKKHHITHGIDFMFPEIAAWRKVKQLLEKKTYGTLRHLDVDWEFLSYDIKHGKKTWKTSAKDGGGALSFYFSHGFYYLEHFAGRIARMKSTRTYAKESKGGAEVAANLKLTFKSGATGHAHISVNHPGDPRHELTFTCTKGTITLKNTSGFVDDFTITVRTKKGVQKLAVKKDAPLRGEDPRAAIVRRLVERFVSACRYTTDMTPSFADGLRVQQLIANAKR